MIIGNPTAGGTWRPGRDHRAKLIPGPAGRPRPESQRSVVVVGGGIAGFAAATALSERGIGVTLLEAQPQLGGRVRSFPVGSGEQQVTMSRGFHAFFRQYYNLRALLRRSDPALSRLRPVADYPLRSSTGDTDSFAGIPRTPPWSVAGFVATSPSFRAADLRRVDIARALELLDVDFPRTFSRYDGVSAAEFLDRLRFPPRARHLALEVFSRSFFADPEEFSAGELIAMFHSYFVGSSEGLLFDVPDDDYDTALWAPLARRLILAGVRIRTGVTVTALDLSGPLVRVDWQPTERPANEWQQNRSSDLPSAEQAGAEAGELTADAAVIALDPAGLIELIDGRTTSVDDTWRERVGRVRVAPPFAVWRLWLDRRVDPDRPAFLGTSGYGPLDNITVLERFEAGAAAWSARHGGSVLELHAYALPGRPDEGAAAQLKRALRSALSSVYPETEGAGSQIEQWLVEQDCVLVDPTPWRDRPTVGTPDPRLVLAGDAIRCELPVALMERAATTGFQAANTLLAGWGVRGHDLWTVPPGARQNWPGRLHAVLDTPGKLLGQPGKLLDRPRKLLGQPGNSPRRRNS